jgi:hypothetical protein
MASPTKNFTDPDGTITPALTGSIHPMLIIGLASFVSTSDFVAAPAQVEEVTSRFSMAPFSTPMKDMVICVPPDIDVSVAQNMSFNTYSSIYQERGSSASRPTEGQLYPTGI